MTRFVAALDPRDELYRRHAASAFRRAQRLLGSSADADEVVHDVFVALFEPPQQQRQAIGMSAYLYAAVTHACLNLIRNRRTRQRLTEQHEHALPKHDAGLGPELTTITDLKFDCFYAGELSGADEHNLRAHLHGCARCSLRCDLLERQRSAFYARAADWHSFAARRAAPVNEKPRRFRGGAGWAVLSAAAALVLALFVRPTAEEQVPSVRSKGRPGLGFYVKQGELVRRGASGERVRPGEMVRFVYSVDQPRYFALLHRDALRASVYFPTGPRATAVEPGRDVALDFAIRLDAELGPERL